MRIAPTFTPKQLARILGMFQQGFDTTFIARYSKARECEIYNALAEYRDRERAV